MCLQGGRALRCCRSDIHTYIHTPMSTHAQRFSVTVCGLRWSLLSMSIPMVCSLSLWHTQQSHMSKRVSRDKSESTATGMTGSEESKRRSHRTLQPDTRRSQNDRLLYTRGAGGRCCGRGHFPREDQYISWRGRGGAAIPSDPPPLATTVVARPTAPPPRTPPRPGLQARPQASQTRPPPC